MVIKTAHRNILVTPGACNGCGECIDACRHAISGEHKKGDIPTSRIQIVKNGESYVPILCHNCEDAPCVSACMPGCRYKDYGRNMVLTDYKRCVGCWMCVMLCPFGAILRIPKREGDHFGVARKCDGCLNKKIAPCVEACKVKALQQIDIDS
jgi:carbon-monoxide dehydrogenase iron sulfur subunit